MNEPLVFSFSSFEAATHAHDTLLAAGFDADAVQLRVLNDEAGPVEGNFLVGNGRTGAGGQLGVGGTDLGPETPYDANFEQAVWRGGHVLMVAVRDAGQRATTATQLLDLGGLDVADAAGGGSASRPQAA